VIAAFAAQRAIVPPRTHQRCIRHVLPRVAFSIEHPKAREPQGKAPIQQNG